MGRNIILVIFVQVVFNHVAYSQQGFYVPDTGKIFFNGDSATIFSNVINKGRLGVGRNAFLNFSGQTWENSPSSFITDESLGGIGITGVGGWVCFLSDSIRQQLIGGYNTATKSGPSFPRLQIQNRFGIELSESNTKVRKQITFIKGLVYLRDYVMSVGDNDPGIISGYDSSRYFVTGNQPGQGLLLRENIRNSDGQIVFPVGSRENAYTPAAIQNNSIQGDDYYMNVFDSVRSNALSGNNLYNSSVNKTWAIGKRFNPGLDNSKIFLQHLNQDEGSFFTANKSNAYVAWFNGSAWDTGAPQNFPALGYLTSGNPLTNSGISYRTFSNAVAAPSYFTKLTGNSNTSLQTTLWFSGQRVDANIVYVYWKTNPEVNVQYFIVQRRLSNESSFTNIDTVFSNINGAISLSELNYSVNDPDSYTGISFYRLQVVNLNTTFFYSDIIAIGGTLGGPYNLIWPNPAQDIFYVSCSPFWQIESIDIYDAAGRKIKQENTNGRSIIQIGGLIPGNYFVSLVRKGGQILETKKLIVVGH
ncbi:MAG TPA: T9SS type A sorting domain-containing protein [Chitinophagaceae bacterium]|nr:T9SS type A sorting domain-containing protein [Chitinophagaceae bacterium]